MAKSPTTELLPAKDLSVADLSSRAEVVIGLETLHNMILELVPDCLMKARGPTDGGFVYVPPERRHAKTKKNLLTIWPEASGTRMRIMPAPEEMFDPSKSTHYRARLAELHSALKSENG